MGTELREALRRLCVEIGWSYAVFWRAIGSPSPKHLVWGDGHWYGKLQPSVSGDVYYSVDSNSEFRSQAECIINELVDKTMVPQVHVIGDGIVGLAASTGNHQWILKDSATDHGSIGKHLDDVSHHFLAGIQTIVIVPVLPQGVLQLGSTKRVMENFLFVNHARISFAQLTCKLGSFYGVTQKSLGHNSLQHHRDSPCRDGCSSVDRSLSIITDRCRHQLYISSASRYLSQPSYTSVTHFDANHENDPAGNSNFIINPSLKIELAEAQEISNGDFLSSNEMPFASVSKCQEQVLSTTGLYSDSLNLMEDNLLSLRGINTTVDGIDVCFDSLLPKNEIPTNANGVERLISASAIQTPFTNLSGTNPMSGQTNSSHGPQGTSLSHCVNSLSIRKSQFISNSGNLKKDKDLSPSSCSGMRSVYLKECSFDSSRTIEANQRIDGIKLHGNHNCVDDKLQNIGGRNDLSFEFMPNEKSSSFPLLATSGDDLFDILGIHDALDSIEASSKNIDSARINQLNIPSTFNSVNDISSTETFSETNTDQLLDAIVSKINTAAIPNLYENTYCKTSVTKLSSPPHCGSSSNDGSASSGCKHGEYYSHYLLKNNAEQAASTSFWSASSLDTTEKPGFNSEVSLRTESRESMKNDKLSVSHAKKADEMGKLSKKRPRPGESSKPRPKDRQLIMDRVKELREIVPNGAKCSIDALLEKTIKHLLFLQSVTKHADKLKETRGPKIIDEDGAVGLKENFQGGATWAFDVGSQPMTCPIIVEDLNPPREMLVEMLCEERGFFLEIADVIRGLGLTILKGVMEVRKDKIWARFAVEANRDVTRMEIFLSLVRLLEPTFGNVASPHTIHNSKMPYQLLDPSCAPVTSTSESFQ